MTTKKRKKSKYHYKMYIKYGQAVSINRLNALKELKKQVEEDYDNTDPKLIRLVKDYAWALGDLNIKQQEEDKLIGESVTWKKNKMKLS